jgi:hypothetical protein
MLEIRFDRRARLVSAVIKVGYAIMITVIQVIAIGTIVSVAVAVVAMMIWGVGSTQPIMLGVATSLVTLVVASLLTAPPDPERLSLWEKRLMGSVETTRGTSP